MKLQGDYERIKGLDAEVVAIGMDTLNVLDRLIQVTGIQYPVLADPDHKVAEAYGVYNLLRDNRPVPSLFIVDEEGVIAWKHVGKKRKDWPDEEDILKQLGQ